MGHRVASHKSVRIFDRHFGYQSPVAFHTQTGLEAWPLLRVREPSCLPLVSGCHLCSSHVVAVTAKISELSPWMMSTSSRKDCDKVQLFPKPRGTTLRAG